MFPFYFRKIITEGSMFFVRALLFSLLLFFVSSCGSRCQRESQTESSKTNSVDSSVSNVTQSPTTIQMNKSIVAAEVLEITPEEGSGYLLKVNVTEVSEDPAYPSFAAKNVTYNLRPAYGVDEEGKPLKNEINEGLLKARNLKPGDKIRGIISMERDMKWYLENFINKD